MSTELPTAKQAYKFYKKVVQPASFFLRSVELFSNIIRYSSICVKCAPPLRFKL